MTRRPRDIVQREIVDSLVLAVVSKPGQQNSSANIIEFTGEFTFLSANEQLEFIARGTAVKGGICLVRIDEREEIRRKLRGRTLNEVMKEMIRREADARDIRIRCNNNQPE